MSQFPGRHKKHRRLTVVTHEPFETFILSQMLQRGDIAIDLGAHVGHYTVSFSLAVGPEGKVFAFEPHPTIFESLIQSIAKNQLTNVVAEQKAISNRKGKANLYLNPRNPGDHRLFDSRNRWQFVEVETITLNDYFKDFTQPIKLIKMDIQGSEMWALQGMTSLIRRNPGLIIASEFWPIGFKTAGINAVDYLRKLSKLGFTLSNINEGTKCLEPITDVIAFTAGYPDTTPLYTNILATLPLPKAPQTTQQDV